MKDSSFLHFVVLGLIFVGLVAVLVTFRGGLTGYVVFEDSGSDFDNGTYANTTYNGSAVVLYGENITGIYTSQIIDAGADATWNNLTLSGDNASVVFLFGVDSGGDIYKSSDYARSWELVSEDYGRTSDTTDMFADSSFVYIISNSNREVWRSSDGGETFTVVNDTFADSGLLYGESNASDSLFVIDASGDVYLSTNSGVTWTLRGDFNGGATNNGKGLALNGSGSLFVVDGSGSVFVSRDYGVNWTEQTSAYGGGSATDDMASNGTDLFILFGKDIYYSDDEGVSWSVLNDSFTEYSQNGVRLLFEESRDQLFLPDSLGRVFNSSNGVLWLEQGDLNLDANNDPKGFTSFTNSTWLDLSVRNCSSSDCSDGSWQSVDTSDIALTGQYFQYRFLFSSPAVNYTSFIENVSVDYSLINGAPALSLYLPSNGTTYGYNESLPLNYSASDADDNLDSCWYALDGGTNVSVSGCVNATFSVSGDGSYTLTLYANDSLGLESSSTHTFNVQIGAPTIELHAPIGTYLNDENVSFTYTPTDLDLDACSLWGNFNGTFISNQTDGFPSSGIVNTFSLHISDGPYIWNVQCNDTVGNSAMNGNKTFSVDSVDPLLNVSEPIGTKTSRTSIPLSFVVVDASPTVCTYNLTTSVGTPVVSNVSISNCTDTTFSVSNDGDYLLTIIVADAAGHDVSKNTSFAVDTSVSESGGESGGSGGGGGGGGGGSVTGPISLTNPSLKISASSEVIVQPGNVKNIPVRAENVGSQFLNECRLTVDGDLSSWASPSAILGIAPGQEVSFLLELVVPEDVRSGSYSSTLSVSCQEATKARDLTAIVPERTGFIVIESTQQEGDELIIIYTLSTDSLIGAETIIEFWLVNADGVEISRVSDVVSLSGDENAVTRELRMSLPSAVAGIYTLSYAFASDSQSVERESVVLGESRGTGFAITGIGVGNRVIGYVVFILFVIVGLFLGFRKQIFSLFTRKHSRKRKR